MLQAIVDRHTTGASPTKQNPRESQETFTNVRKARDSKPKHKAQWTPKTFPHNSAGFRWCFVSQNLFFYKKWQIFITQINKIMTSIIYGFPVSRRELINQKAEYKG